MQRPKFGACLVMLLGVGSTGPLDAQGPIIDWIHRLSGPGIGRLGFAIPLKENFPTFERPQPGLDESSDSVKSRGSRLMLTPMVGTKVSAREGSDADTASIWMGTVQLTLDAPFFKIGNGVEVRGVIGAAGHVWWGSFDTFVNFSFPAQLVLRVPSVKGLTIGTGFDIFWFPDDAFQPLDVNVQTDGFEGAWVLVFGFDELFRF